MKKNEESIFNVIGSIVGFYIVCSLFFGGINQIQAVQEWKSERAKKSEILYEAKNKDYKASIKGKFKIEPLFWASELVRLNDEMVHWPSAFGPSLVNVFILEKKYVYDSLDSCENYKDAYSSVISFFNKDVELNCSVIN